MSDIWGRKIILHDLKTQYLNTSLTSLIFRCTYHLNTDLSSPAFKCHLNIRQLFDFLMLFLPKCPKTVQYSDDGLKTVH